VSTSTAIALGFAGVAVIGYGVGSVAQAAGARRSADTVRALSQPRYLAGVGCDLLAWLASLAALHTLPVYEVQALLAGSLAVTVVTARVALAARLRRRDLAAIAATILALAVVARSAGPQHPVRTSGTLTAVLVTAAVLLALAGWLTARSGSAIASAALAGAAFGGAALSARALPQPHNPLHHPGATVAQLAITPIAWALVGFGITGTVLYAHALRLGAVGPVTAVLWAIEVVVPAIVGFAILDDAPRPGWAPWTVVAVTTVVFASAVLATAPAHTGVLADARAGNGASAS
jgi:hypothetical protein